MSFVLRTAIIPLRSHTNSYLEFGLFLIIEIVSVPILNLQRGMLSNV